MPAHKIKAVVPIFECPEHGVPLERGGWVKMIIDIGSGVVRYHYICRHLERVTVEEHPDNMIFYHRAPRVRRREKPTTFDTDRRLL